MEWHKEMLRGFRDNAAYEGGRYLILALLAAAWPILNGILQRPWYWKLNAVLIFTAVVLFFVAIVKFTKTSREFSRSSRAKKKNIGFMKPATGIISQFPYAPRPHPLEKIPKVVDEMNERTRRQVGKRNAVLDKAVDIIKEQKREKERKNSQLEVDTFAAIATARADKLWKEDDVVWLCDQISGPHPHPFAIFNQPYAPVQKGEWLEFLKAYWNYAAANDRVTVAWTFSITHWRGKDRWLNRPVPQMRDLNPPSGEHIVEPP